MSKTISVRREALLKKRRVCRNCYSLVDPMTLRCPYCRPTSRIKSYGK